MSYRYPRISVEFRTWGGGRCSFETGGKGPNEYRRKRHGESERHVRELSIKRSQHVLLMGNGRSKENVERYKGN